MFRHLGVDVRAYYNHIAFFIRQGTLHQGYNEYQPIATLFFLFPSLFVHPFTLSAYFPFFIGMNVFIVAVLPFLYKKINDRFSLSLYLLLLISIGPIILYRFESLVMTEVLLCVLFWKKSYSLSAFFLSLGTLTKLYPILYLPYFVITLTYMTFFRLKISDVIYSLEYHNLKSIEILSIFASILTLARLIWGQGFPGYEARFGIHAIDRSQIIFPLSFYNYFWLIPIGMFYLWFFLKSKKKDSYEEVVFITLTILFLIASKNQAPQYYMWFVLLIPLIKDHSEWKKEIILVMIIGFISLYIYPLHYDEYINHVNNNWTLLYFSLNTLKNAFLILLGVLCVRKSIQSMNNHKDA